MAYDQGNVNGLWRIKPTGGDQVAIGVEMSPPEPIEPGENGCCVYGANGEFERPMLTMNGDPFAGKPLS